MPGVLTIKVCAPGCGSCGDVRYAHTGAWAYTQAGLFLAKEALVPRDPPSGQLGKGHRLRLYCCGGLFNQWTM